MDLPARLLLYRIYVCLSCPFCLSVFGHVSDYLFAYLYRLRVHSVVPPVYTSICMSLVCICIMSNMSKSVGREPRELTYLIHIPRYVLSAVTVSTFSDFYPELAEKEALIVEIITDEEQAFSTMVSRGVRHFTQLVADMEGRSEGKLVSGEDAFFMYDSLGFPLDLTQLMAEEKGLEVDIPGFEAMMEAQKQRSRVAQKKSRGLGDSMTLELGADETAWLTSEGMVTTDDGLKYGADLAEVEGKMQALYTQDGFAKEGDVFSEGDVVGILLDRSPFYAESGGQVADTGVIESGGATLEVKDVRVFAGYVLHTGQVVSGSLMFTGSMTAKSSVDSDRRDKVATSHTMTHVLNAALRSVLGDGVNQKGSLNSDDRLRFDFSHGKALSPKQLEQVEAYCNDIIDSAYPVTSEVIPLAEAKELPGVIAMFGETYPDPVRVVFIDGDRSTEFCGGTHISNTNTAKAFTVLEETAVAKGIRRIVAVTKEAAVNARVKGQTLLSETEAAAELKGVALQESSTTIRRRLEEQAPQLPANAKAQIRSRLEQLQKKVAAEQKAELAAKVSQGLSTMESAVTEAGAQGLSFVVLELSIGTDNKVVKQAVNACKKLGQDVAVLGLSTDEYDDDDDDASGKVLCFAHVPAALEADLAADTWVRAALEPFQGRGGGNKNMAQGSATTTGGADGLRACMASATDAATDVFR